MNIHRQSGANTGDGIINQQKLQRLIRADDIIDMTVKERDAELARISKMTDDDILAESLNPAE